MRIVYGLGSFEVTRVEDEQRLTEKLSSLGCSKSVLGDDSAYPGRFELIHFDPEHVSGQAFAVAVITETIRPSLLILDRDGLILIGFNDRIAGIRSSDGAVLFEVKLSWYVQCLHAVPAESSVLVFFEVGVTKLTYAGDVQWEWEGSDIITRSSILPDCVELELDTGGKVRLSLSTGAMSEGQNSGR